MKAFCFTNDIIQETMLKRIIFAQQFVQSKVNPIYRNHFSKGVLKETVKTKMS